MVKWFIKIVWLGLGVFGLYNVTQTIWPQATPENLVKGVQGVLQPDLPFQADEAPVPLSLTDLKDLEPQEAGEVLGEVVKTEVVRILEAAGEQITAFPAKQVRKIKIGACEELLEEDICSVAKEIQCE